MKQTGTILSVPVGDGFLGRVVDALGRPVDGRGRSRRPRRANLEVQAPNVVSRQPVKEAALHRHHGDRRDDRRSGGASGS